jgi:hypothetical protein
MTILPTGEEAGASVVCTSSLTCSMAFLLRSRLPW